MDDLDALRDDPGLASDDVAMLRAAATGEAGIPITNADQLRALGEAASRTKRGFDDEFRSMTREQAEYVRRLRCDEDYSWRAVASTCALEWGGEWGSNQLAGMAICERAAEMFGEQYKSDPWN